LSKKQNGALRKLDKLYGLIFYRELNRVNKVIGFKSQKS